MVDTEDSSSASMFSAMDPVWMFPKSAAQDLPDRWGHSGVLANGKLYIYGGCRGGFQFSDVLMLDMETMFWTVLVTTGEEPGGRDSHTAFLFGDKMVIFGGTSGSKKTNDVYVLDLDSLVWSRPFVEGLAPEPRESHTATVINKKQALIFGGSGNEGYLNDVHILDCETMRWTSPQISGSAPSSRDSHSSVVVGNQLLLYGGDCGDCYLGDLDVLDLQTFTWSKLDLASSATKPGVRAGHTAVVVDSKIYFFGGVGERVYYDDVWVLDVESRTWFPLNVGCWEPQGRFSHVAALGEDGMIVYGGCGEDEKPLNELLILHLGQKRIKENKWRKMMQSDDEQKKAVQNRRRPIVCRRNTAVETLAVKRRDKGVVMNSVMMESSPDKDNSGGIGNEFTSKRTAKSAAHDHDLRQKKICTCKSRSSENEESSGSESEQEPVKSSVLSNPGKATQDHPLDPSFVQPSQLRLENAQMNFPEAVYGVVDGVFDSGYLMSAHVNGQVFRGVLFRSGTDVGFARSPPPFLNPAITVVHQNCCFGIHPATPTGNWIWQANPPSSAAAVEAALKTNRGYEDEDLTLRLRAPGM